MHTDMDCLTYSVTANIYIYIYIWRMKKMWPVLVTGV